MALIEGGERRASAFLSKASHVREPDGERREQSPPLCQFRRIDRREQLGTHERGADRAPEGRPGRAADRNGGKAIALRAGEGAGPWRTPIQRGFGPVYTALWGMTAGRVPWGAAHHRAYDELIDRILRLAVMDGAR